MNFIYIAEDKLTTQSNQNVSSIDAINKMLAPHSMASIKSWLKSQGLSHSANGRMALAERVLGLFKKSQLTLASLKSALIGIEETGAKRIYIYQISATATNISIIGKTLNSLGINVTQDRIASPTNPTKTTLVYTLNGPDEFRAKWCETHTKYKTDVDSLTVLPKKETKVIVAILDKKSGLLQLRYDKPETRHPHGLNSHWSADAYFTHFREQTENLLGQSFEGVEIRPALDKLIKAVPRLVEVESNDALTDDGMTVKMTSQRKGKDVRDAKDWGAMESHGAKVRTHESEAVYWQPGSSHGKLQREFFTFIDGRRGFIRFDADCHEGEIDYALSHLA